MAKNFVSNKDETVRMFDNDILNSLSKVHFSVPLIIYVPLTGYLLYLSIAIYSLSFLNIIGLIIGGMLTWSAAEYLLHRFVFHYPAKTKIGKKIHFIFHGVHHDYPSDSKRLVMPPSVSIPLAVIFYFLFRTIFGPITMLPFFAGFIVGYLFYDMTHYAIHHYNMHNKFWLAVKNYHMKHHYQDEDKGYGVTSPFWDLIFRTDFKKSQTTSD